MSYKSGENLPVSAPVSLLRDIDHIQGDRNAKVVLLQYGSYQCPLSAGAYAKAKDLVQCQEQAFCFVFRHFPMPEQYSQAQKAAETAEAAAAQNRFWEMHNTLFDNQHQLEDSHLLEYAILVGLNIPQFLQEISSRRYAERVQLDVDLGLESGVKDMPTFFINVCHQGTQNLEGLLVAILNATENLTP